MFILLIWLISTCPFKAGDSVPIMHARVSSVFSLIDNRTVIFTSQDFLPDRIAEGVVVYHTQAEAHDPERATPMLNLCHGVLTDQFIFRHILS